jgi:hypothetical protein
LIGDSRDGFGRPFLFLMKEILCGMEWGFGLMWVVMNLNPAIWEAIAGTGWSSSEPERGVI